MKEKAKIKFKSFTNLSLEEVNEFFNTIQKMAFISYQADEPLFIPFLGTFNFKFNEQGDPDIVYTADKEILQMIKDCDEGKEPEIIEKLFGSIVKELRKEYDK